MGRKPLIYKGEKSDPVLKTRGITRDKNEPAVRYIGPRLDERAGIDKSAPSSTEFILPDLPGKSTGFLIWGSQVRVLPGAPF